MTRPRKPTATKGSRGSSLKTNSKVREVREKSIIDSPHDNEHESSNEREVRAQHDEADYLESLSRSREKTPQQEEREIEREEEIERREREREREKRERARRERERENREREIERESREKEIEREKRGRRERERNEENESEKDNFHFLPPQFEEMSNQLQVCNWLIAHPEILNLANKMLTAKSQDTGILSMTSQPQPNNLIYKIFGLEPFKKEAEKLAHDASKKFTDYRNKYNESIILLVKDMREIEREIPTNISDHEVNEFIFEDVVVKKLLR
ncbi:hypothetical protein RhiirC2_713339 [Rhizophagus irregularis]|uniref:Uncharacterized protein n=1 Tax=Rhizophagus irregularis TaxID=588596 RepID=A0A2N1N3Q1_9GLOM|nr:hypothetical protein RhiirC2_713339 [Rhizophagus irregularis]